MIIAVCAALLPMAVSAETTYTYGDFSYKIDTGAVVITKYNGSSAVVSIPNTISQEENCA